MSIADKLSEDKVKEASDHKNFIQQKKDELYKLKERRGLFEDADFIWFYKKYIQVPYTEADASHTTCTETNKNFLLKGQVLAFKSIMKCKSELYTEIENITEVVRNYELEQKTETEEHNPIN